jgi:hypothetical protein
MDIQNKERYGKDENSVGGRDARWNKSAETRMGIVRGEGFPYGAKQIRTLETDNSGGHPNWKLTPVRDTTAGKILERLELLETQTLGYIHSHQERLKARLGESEQTEEEFLKESNQIKSDIYHLAVAQQQETNGNGHQ